jgi:hypothetical protein|tara:strand:- start:3409 stop:3588 length:180 start_codon:yes stop_codon:yes gene_type:complete
MFNETTKRAFSPRDERSAFVMPFADRFFNSFGWQLLKDSIGLLCVVFICISVLFLGVIL